MEIVYGINPLTEALRVEPCRLVGISVAKGATKQALKEVIKLASEKKIPVVFRERRELDKLSCAKLHQGVVGFHQSFVYADTDEIMRNRNPAFSNDLIVVLDGITDPQNLGALIRTAHCQGANGVIIPEHRAAPVTAAVVKASAGAALITPVSRVTNLSRTIEDLKRSGVWIYGADAHAGRSIHEMIYQGNVGLVIGSEGRGIRELIRKQCDFLLYVPMFGKVDSMNVSVAAGIILSDIVRKWTQAEGVR